MSENLKMEPEEKTTNQSKRDFITSQIAKFFKERDQKLEKLEKKISSDIQVIEVLKYDFVDMLKFVETETEELELLEIQLGNDDQYNDRQITHIKEEDEENSSSDEELNLKKSGSTSNPPEIFTKTTGVKKSDSNPFQKPTKKDSDDGLIPKYDYSKVNTKRDDKKFDELTARYDYSRVAQKRPTMLEKQFNISNTNLIKKETDRKSVADPKRDDKKLPTLVRRSTVKPGGTIIGIDKPLIFGKNNNNTGNTTNENIANKTQNLEPDFTKEIASENQAKRKSDRRVSMAVAPVKRDTISIPNNNKTIVSKSDSNPEPKKEEPVKQINQIPNGKTDTAQVQKQAVNQAKLLALIQKINDKKYNTFSSIPLCALHLTLKTGFLEPKDKYKLITSSGELYKSPGLHSLSKIAVNKLSFRLNYLEDLYSIYLQDSNVKSLINKQFAPTKTAEHGLSFIKKEDELNLTKNNPGEDIIGVFKFIYVLIDESIEGIAPENIIDNLFNSILPRLGYTNIRQLFLEFVTLKREIDDLKYGKLIEIIQANPNVLASHFLIKQNRSVSYMTFFLKEIFDYFSLKTSDGMLVYKLRNIQNEVNKLTQRIMSENEKANLVNP